MMFKMLDNHVHPHHLPLLSLSLSYLNIPLGSLSHRISVTIENPSKQPPLSPFLSFSPQEYPSSCTTPLPPSPQIMDVAWDPNVMSEFGKPIFYIV